MLSKAGGSIVSLPMATSTQLAADPAAFPTQNDLARFLAVAHAAAVVATDVLKLL